MVSIVSGRSPHVVPVSLLSNFSLVYAFSVTLFRYGFHVSLWSKITPRYVTYFAGFIVVWSTVMASLFGFL